MTFALGLFIGLILGAALTLGAMHAVCLWLAGRDDDAFPRL